MGLKETLDALFHEMGNPGVLIFSFVTGFIIMELARMHSSKKK